jgi:biopolymer transport protein TolR
MPKVQSFEHETGGHSRRSRRTTSSLAEINVVPLVDVMLVLLIIFMVTAPMMQHGMSVKLPTSRRAATNISAERPIITLPLSYRKDKRVMLGNEPVRTDMLAERVRQQMVARADKSVFLRMDGGLTTQEMMDVIDRLKDGGVEDVALVTEQSKIVR